jgi:hypothetical protein
MFRDWNEKAAGHALQPGEKCSQAIQARQVGRRRRDLECTPLDHRLRGQDDGSVPFANSYLNAAPQQETEIGAGKHRASRVGWNIMDMEQGSMPSDPGTDLAWRSTVLEELAQCNVG